MIIELGNITEVLEQTMKIVEVSITKKDIEKVVEFLKNQKGITLINLVLIIAVVIIAIAFILGVGNGAKDETSKDYSNKTSSDKIFTARIKSRS